MSSFKLNFGFKKIETWGNKGESDFNIKEPKLESFVTITVTKDDHPSRESEIDKTALTRVLQIATNKLLTEKVGIERWPRLPN